MERKILTLKASLKNNFYLTLLGVSLFASFAWLNQSSANNQKVYSQVVAPLAKVGSKWPRLRVMPNGDQLMSWVEPQNAGHALKFGVLRDGKWLKQGMVAQGENWFVNWADYPSVVAIDDKFWVAHWLAKQNGGKTFDYDVALAISNDAGNTWREIGHPHRDKGVAAEHGFVTIFTDAGEAGIVWLDGREYVTKEDKAQDLNKTNAPKKSGNFNLRYTRIHRNGTFEKEQVIDSNTCTCCWTSVASTSEGAVVAWRGRTDDEIRDNRIALLRDGKWSAPKALGAEGWNIDGCPVNGPTVVSLGLQVAAAWFTAEGGRPRVRVAFSKDGGENFAQPIEVDEASPLGRIGLVWKDNQTAVVSWMTATDATNKKSQLVLRAIKTDGTLGAYKKVADVSAGRDTGVPQMLATKQGLLFAWTGNSPDYGIKTTTLSWQEFATATSARVTFFETASLPFTPLICAQH